MTRPLAVLVPVAAAAVLLAALTGCTPGGAGSPAPTASVPSPLVTGVAADTAAPQPGIDIDCAGLVDPVALSGAFPAGVHSVDPHLTQAGLGPDIPDADVLQSAGGLSCEWNNGLAFSTGPDDPDHYAGLQLSVLPRAAAQWARYDAEYGAGGEGVHCNPVSSGLYCGSEQLVGTTWVSIAMFGVGGEAGARALVEAINTAAAGAAPGAAAWTPPSGTTTFGDCTQLLTPAQVAHDLGVSSPGIHFNADAAGGWSIQAGARAQTDAIGCLLQFVDEDNVAGQVNWLRGGAWAYDRTLALAAPGWGTPAATAIAGLRDGDRAQLRCTDPSAGDEESADMCTVDLLLGGNWIQVIIEPNPGDPHITVAVRTGALAVATDLVSGYNAHSH